MSKLTHFNASGDAHMVDVGGKAVTRRLARASGRITMQRETLDSIARGEQAKGDVIAVARLAGIMAAKRTADLVPLCHPLALTRVEVDFELQPEDAAVACSATVETDGKTGVEMEALTAVQVALLTIYDMCKAVDRAMRIDAVQLEEKRGGKSGTWLRADDGGASTPA